MKVLVFDTETTGLPKERNASITQTELWPHIIQLSYILYDVNSRKVIVDCDDIIKLGNDIEISEESINIHKITRQISQKKGISLKKAIRKFNEAMDKAHVIVGHNIEFDKNMIMVSCIRLNEPQRFTINNIRKPEYCTMKKTTELCKIPKKNNKTGEIYWKYPRLSELYEKLFHETPHGCHNAMADVIFCLRCYVKVKIGRDLFIDACDRLNIMYNNYCK